MNSTERLLDLVAFLLSSRSPVPLNDIYAAFEDEYTGSRDTRDRKFGRDKEALRDLGIPVAYVSSEEEGESGYIIDRSAFYLPDIALTADERAALFAIGAAASRAAFPLQSELAHALTKLRSTGPNGEERAQPVLFTASTRSSGFEETIVRALAERRRLRVVYPPEQASRLFEPYAISRRRDRFAVVGFCHLRQGIRMFYADRMAECSFAHPSGPGGEFELPADFNAAEHFPNQPWQLRLHDPIEVELEFSPELANSGPRTLGLEPGQKCRTTNLDGLIAQVLALGQGVRIAGPPEARARVREKLTMLSNRLGGES
jgi:proteasome accessory factor B